MNELTQKQPTNSNFSSLRNRTRREQTTWIRDLLGFPCDDGADFGDFLPFVKAIFSSFVLVLPQPLFGKKLQLTPECQPVIRCLTRNDLATHTNRLLQRLASGRSSLGSGK